MSNLKKHRDEILKTSLTIVLANIVLGFAVSCFIKPHGIIMGGGTGLSLSMEHYFGLDFSLCVGIINVFTFLLGFLILGRKFALTTILSTILYPLSIKFWLSVDSLQGLTDDVLLSTILGALLMGVGMGLILRMGASTGGMDIPPLILNAKFHIPVAASLYTFDTCILLTQLGFSSKEQVLYGILFTVMNSVIINKVIMMGSQRSQLFIISKRYQEIKELLLHDLNLGVTMVAIEAALSQEEMKGVLCITTNRNVYKVSSEVQKLDPFAFITIDSINEVKGRGFSMARDASTTSCAGTISGAATAPGAATVPGADTAQDANDGRQESVSPCQ